MSDTKKDVHSGGSSSQQNPTSSKSSGDTIRVERSDLSRDLRQAIKTNIQIGRSTAGNKKK